MGDLLDPRTNVTLCGVIPGTSSRDTLAARGRFGVGGEMARSGQDAGEPPRASAAADNSGPLPRPGAPHGGNGMAVRLVALGLVRHMLRSRRFYERVAVAVIVLRSLRGIGQDNRASMTARLAAWNKREMQRLEHKAEREARAVRGAGRMARSGRPRGLAKTMPTRTESDEHGN